MQCWDNSFAERFEKCHKDFKQKAKKQLRVVGVLLEIYSVPFTCLPNYYISRNI